MAPHEKHTQPIPQFSPEGLSVIAIGVGILLLLVMTAPSSSHPPSAWTIRRNAIKKICMAVGEYREVHGVYPPVCVYDDKGQPSQSWRAMVLPYLDQQPLSYQYHFDEPWNGPNNFHLRTFCPDLYRNLNWETKSENNIRYRNLHWEMKTGNDFHCRQVMLLVRNQDLKEIKSAPWFPEDQQNDSDEVPLIIDLTHTENFWNEPWDLEFKASSILPGEPQGRGYVVGNCDTGIATVMPRNDLVKLLTAAENSKTQEATVE